MAIFASIEEERKVFTVQKVTEDTERQFEKEKYYGADITACALSACFYQIKGLYPDRLHEIIAGAVKKYGMIDLNNKIYEIILGEEDYKYLVDIAKELGIDISSLDTPVVKELSEEEKQIADPLKEMLDVFDPGMFEFKGIEMSEDGKSTQIICSKVKGGKSKLVSLINEADKKIVKCSIDSKELKITIFNDSYNEFVEWAINTLAETAMELVADEVVSKVAAEVETGANNIDYAAIAEQYGVGSVEELKAMAKTQDGRDELINRLVESAKKNGGIKEEMDKLKEDLKITKDPEAKPVKKERSPEDLAKESEELISKNETLKIITDSFKASKLDPVYHRGIQGLTICDLFFNGEKKGTVTLDVREAVLGPELKWSPEVINTVEEALDAPWYMITVNETWQLLYNYVIGTKSKKEVSDYVGLGRLYGPMYLNLNTHINMNEVYRSKMLDGKSHEERAQLMTKLVELNTTGLLQESQEIENGTYYRLFKYTDPNNFILISDGRTRNWLAGKPVAVKKGLKLTCKDGAWEASGFVPKKKEEVKSKSVEENASTPAKATA